MRIALYLAVLTGAVYVGHLYGSAQTPVCNKPAVKRLSVQDMDKRATKLWAKYLAARSY